jgi:hypothetical protein
MHFDANFWCDEIQSEKQVLQASNGYKNHICNALIYILMK